MEEDALYIPSGAREQRSAGETTAVSARFREAGVGAYLLVVDARHTELEDGAGTESVGIYVLLFSERLEQGIP